MFYHKKISSQLLLSLIITSSICLVLFSGCNKEEFLSKKPNSSLVVPTTIEELRGLLDDESKVWQTPILGLQSSDEYYWSYTDWNAQSAKLRNTYIWASNIYDGQSSYSEGDWDSPFNQIFIANVVLEGINKIKPNAEQLGDWRATKGAAYFLRAKALFALAEVFCLPYDETTAQTDLGLPIRLESRITAEIKRSNLQQTYAQIHSDLDQAKDLLDETTFNSNRIRPTKLTVYALLARIYLAQRKYDLAGLNADNVLKNYSILMNFNGLTTFVLPNIETLYYNTVTTGIQQFSTASGILNVDPLLYNLYSTNDLRKTLYYKVVANGRITFNRMYSGSAYPFTGLATDELYLIRAEWYARNNQLEKAAKDVNDLLVTRYATNTYTDIVFNSPTDALAFILQERRKELAFRGARWSDVRRLNKEGYNITMKRSLNNIEYKLPPNDLRFALSIPQYEIDLSGIEQNRR